MQVKFAGLVVSENREKKPHRKIDCEGYMCSDEVVKNRWPEFYTAHSGEESQS